MLGSAIIDVAIGLIFVYLLLSLLCSAVSEIIEAFLKKRAKNLARGIKVLLLEDPSLVEKIYKHPLIDGLFRGEYEKEKKRPILSKLPSYIPPQNFSLALMSIAELDAESLQDSIDKIPNQKIKDAIKALAVAVKNDMDKLQKNIEAWYNGAMERISGWYKRRAQWIILAIAYVAAISMNVSTITIVDRLSDDGALREVLVTQAQEFAKQTESIEPGIKENDGQPGNITPEANDKESGQQPTPSEKFIEIKGEIEKLGLPIGWSESVRPKDLRDWLIHFIGWSATAFAVTMGAPFWFDLLNKFVTTRSTVKSKEVKSPETTPK